LELFLQIWLGFAPGRLRIQAELVPVERRRRPRAAKRTAVTADACSSSVVRRWYLPGSQLKNNYFTEMCRPGVPNSRPGVSKSRPGVSNTRTDVSKTPPGVSYTGGNAPVSSVEEVDKAVATRGRDYTSVRVCPTVARVCLKLVQVCLTLAHVCLTPEETHRSAASKR